LTKINKNEHSLKAVVVVRRMVTIFHTSLEFVKILFVEALQSCKPICAA